MQAAIFTTGAVVLEMIWIAVLVGDIRRPHRSATHRRTHLFLDAGMCLILGMISMLSLFGGYEAMTGRVFGFLTISGVAGLYSLLAALRQGRLAGRNA